MKDATCISKVFQGGTSDFQLRVGKQKSNLVYSNSLSSLLFDELLFLDNSTV